MPILVSVFPLVFLPMLTHCGHRVETFDQVHIFKFQPSHLLRRSEPFNKELSI